MISSLMENEGYHAKCAGMVLIGGDRRSFSMYLR